MSPTPVPAAQQPSRRKTSAPDGAASERQLARWIAEGDDEAVAELFDLMGSTLFALALGITEDAARAEAVVEETFAELWEKRAGLSRLPALSPWMMERCRALAMGLRTGNKAPAPVSLSEATGEVPLAGRLLRCPPAIRSSRVHQALGRLNSRERQVVVLASRAGLGVAEIARRTGTHADEVCELLRAGLRSFRQGLDGTLRRESP